MGGKIVTFKADEELVEAIDEIARMKGLSRSELIRRVLKEYVKLARGEGVPYRVVRLSS